MAETFQWGSNLTTVEEIRNSAWFTKNTDIKDDFIDLYREKSRWDVWTYVAWRYNLSSFTSERFMWSLAFWLLKWCQMFLASAYLLQEWYGSQRLEEEEGSKTKYDQQMAILDDIRKGNTRLLDKDNVEFDLVPKSPNNTVPSSISSSFNTTVPRDFKTSDKR